MIYKPSDVSLTHSFPPLVGTLQRTESEGAALLMLRALVLVKGDAWVPIAPKDLGRAVEIDLAEQAQPLLSLSRNPFFRPDFHGLVKDGFAVWLGDPEVPNCEIEFTPAGISALSSHVAPSKRGPE
jgi:hypothetical protein